MENQNFNKENVIYTYLKILLFLIFWNQTYVNCQLYVYLHEKRLF